MSNQDNNVFLYWIGKDFTLIEILRDLIYYHSNDSKNYKVHLITPDNIGDYVEVPSYFYSMSPNHQSNFVRVKVIRKHGGIWLDSDTIVMDSLSSLFDIIDKQDGFFILENSEYCCDGVFGSKKETPLMIEWEKRMDSILTAKQDKLSNITDYPLHWRELGIDVLHGIIDDLKMGYIKDYVMFHGLDNVYPINWDQCLTEYIKKPYENYKNIIRNYQPLIILVNSVYRELEHYSKEEILNLEIPLTYFLKKSRSYKGTDPISHSEEFVK